MAALPWQTGPCSRSWSVPRRGRSRWLQRGACGCHSNNNDRHRRSTIASSDAGRSGRQARVSSRLPRARLPPSAKRRVRDDLALAADGVSLNQWKLRSIAAAHVVTRRGGPCRCRSTTSFLFAFTVAAGGVAGLCEAGLSTPRGAAAVGPAGARMVTSVGRGRGRGARCPGDGLSFGAVQPSGRIRGKNARRYAAVRQRDLKSSWSSCSISS